MTRKQFKVEYKLIREGGARCMVAAGKMRPSARPAMTRAGVDKEAESFWWKNRANLEEHGEAS